MTEIKYEGSFETIIKNEENRIKQGDFVFCRGNVGTYSFWGIYKGGNDGGVISLDGASGEYVKGGELYLYDTYSYWTIEKRIKCNDAKLVISEI